MITKIGDMEMTLDFPQLLPRHTIRLETKMKIAINKNGKGRAEKLPFFYLDSSPLLQIDEVGAVVGRGHEADQGRRSVCRNDLDGRGSRVSQSTSTYRYCDHISLLDDMVGAAPSCGSSGSVGCVGSSCHCPTVCRGASCHELQHAVGRTADVLNRDQVHVHVRATGLQSHLDGQAGDLGIARIYGSSYILDDEPGSDVVDRLVAGVLGLFPDFVRSTYQYGRSDSGD